jgi:hypothetical protein
MLPHRVDEVDRQLTRLHAWRDRMTRDAFLREANKLLDYRNRLALVAQLEAEYAGELGVSA